MKKELETITPRQLRELLFHLDKNEMTIKTLRSMLFDIENQDEEFQINHGLFYKLEREAVSVKES